MTRSNLYPILKPYARGDTIHNEQYNINFYIMRDNFSYESKKFIDFQASSTLKLRTVTNIIKR